VSSHWDVQLEHEQLLVPCGRQTHSPGELTCKALQFLYPVLKRPFFSGLVVEFAPLYCFFHW